MTENNAIEKKEYDIGIALSGGGAKGFAHAGVLQALEEYHIYPDIIAGTSAGAIVGSLYADGCTPIEIIDLFNRSSFSTYATPARSRVGLFKIDHFRTALENKLKAKSFEELKIPLIINATDMLHGKNIFFHSGTLIDKVIASCSVPVVFVPETIDGIDYSDGGLICNFPVEAIRKRCRYVIGVNVGPVDVTPDEKLNIVDIMQRTYFFIRKANVLNVLKDCDILIEPPSIDKYGMFDAEKNVEIFTLGYEAARKILAENPEMVSTLQTICQAKGRTNK